MNTTPLLTKQFLEDLGINLTDEDYVSLAHSYEEVLYARIVNEVVQELSDDQLEQMQSLQTEGDKILPWLKENVPQLKDIIEDEVAILLAEIAENSDQLTNTSI